MATPTAPPVIRIKRKRDDAPLEALYLEGGTAKRRVTEDIYVFRRFQQESQAPPLPVADNGIPTVRATLPGEEKRDPWALKKVEPPQNPIPIASSAPRRFHLSRPVTPSLDSTATKRARKSEVATFIERKRSATSAHNVLTGGTEAAAAAAAADGILEPPARKLKRPNAKTRVPMLENARITAGQDAGALQPDQQVLNQMAAWADATEEADKKRDITISGKAHVNEPLVDPSAGRDVEDMDIDNEGDYVYDTYVRHIVSADTEMEDSGAVGHLVIPEEHQELWETYIDDENEDDKEFDTDDEDSNAEDYYGADYPEDEVAEDDEYGQGAYEEYRNAASDEEEWGDRNDDEVFGSDSEGGAKEFARTVRTVRTQANSATSMQPDAGSEMSE